MRLRRGFSYANVASTLALFIALGGTGYAAYSLPRNSVGSRELRPHSVGRSELRTGAVSSASVRDGSLTTKDLSPSARAALSGKQGPPGLSGAKGDTGPAGPTGLTGPPGPAAASDWVVVDSVARPVAGTTRDVTTDP